MPPKKRTSTGTGGSGQNKRQRASNDLQPEEGQNGPSDASDQQDDNNGREQFGYYCIPIPYSEFKAQFQDDDDEDDDEDDDDEGEGPKGSAGAAYEKQFKNDFLLKPAADTPDHKWIATWETWKFITDYKHRADFVDPDNFGMHIYTDFAGYGMQELVENMLLAFDKHFKKKDRGEETVKLMWSTAAAVGHLLWLLDSGPWMGSDDAERINATVGVVGNMALTALNELDRAGLLKADSPIQDIGLVIGLFAIWGKDLEADYDFEETSWVNDIVAYAARANIDLRQMPLHSLGKILDDLAEESEEPLAALEGPAKADRWGWKKSLKGLGPEIGGKHYDITQMSRKQRIEYSLDGVDPLADFSEKDIKAGNVALA